MTKFVLTFLAAANLAAPVLAETSRPLEFDRGGIHYVGTVTDRADGTQLIAGHEARSGRAFSLLVARGNVSGLYDGQPVNYAAPHNSIARPTEIASGM